MTDARMVRNLDVRVRERNLKAGLITKEDVRSHLDGLEDVSYNADVVGLRQPGFPGEDDDVVADEAEGALAEATDADELGSDEDTDDVVEDDDEG